MWMFTKLGCFSVVAQSEDILLLQSPNRKHLEEFQHYLPAMSEIESLDETTHQATISRDAFAIALLQMVVDPADTPFCEPGDSSLAAEFYQQLQTGTAETTKPEPIEDIPPVLEFDPLAGVGSHPYDFERAYGGVLINSQREILLCKPVAEAEGFVWTFPKGRMQPGDTPEIAALREVHAATGYRTEIIRKLPGIFEGGTNDSEYFLMRPLGNPAEIVSQTTEEIVWLAFPQAVEYIQQTRNQVGRNRDLDILEMAQQMLDS